MIPRKIPLPDRLRWFVTSRYFIICLAFFVLTALPTLSFGAGEIDATALEYSPDYGVIIGTQSGVVFDGTTVPLGYVNDIAIRDRVAWISSDTGLVGIDLVSSEEVPLLSEMFFGSIPTSDVSFDEDGGLWVGTVASGVVHIEAGCVRLEEICTRQWYDLQEGVPSNNILSILASNDGSVWAGTPSGLGLYREGQWDEVPAFSEKWVYDIQEYSNGSAQGGHGTLFAGTSRGVFYTTDKNEWTVLDETMGKVIPAMLKIDGDLIVATEDELIRYPEGNLENPMFVRKSVGPEWIGSVKSMIAPSLENNYVMLGFEDGGKLELKKHEWSEMWAAE